MTDIVFITKTFNIIYILDYAPKGGHSLCILIGNLEIRFNLLGGFEQEEESSRNVTKSMLVHFLMVHSICQHLWAKPHLCRSILQVGVFSR